ncbi:MAG: type VI secretion system baseplate subunit TssF, partial [Alcanivorax sp.]|nr:type VI secretion system baseplate subunit TssF [Alcanivorax sp.]
MREYFESEMRLLHDAAVDFAKAHPEQARMLNLQEVRDRDPYVERLLEGMAFIAAQIRSQIDDSESANSEQLLEQLCPGQLRALPSSTVLAVTPDRHSQGLKTVPAASRVASNAVGEIRQRCRFSTLAELVVAPLDVQALASHELPNGDTRLDITLQMRGSGSLAELGLEHLDFYLHADQALALSL